MAKPTDAQMAAFVQERYGHLLKPENVFDLTNSEHRQLLIKQLEREWADSMTVGLCVGDVSKAEIVTIMRSEFAEFITDLKNFWTDQAVSNG
jgi:hypothetical protein